MILVLFGILFLPFQLLSMNGFHDHTEPTCHTLDQSVSSVSEVNKLPQDAACSSMSASSASTVCLNNASVNHASPNRTSLNNTNLNHASVNHENSTLWNMFCANLASASRLNQPGLNHASSASAATQKPVSSADLCASCALSPTLLSTISPTNNRKVYSAGVQRMTPLMQALTDGNNQAFNTLIATADLNASDSKGWTALHYAVVFNEGVAVNALLRHGATLTAGRPKAYKWVIALERLYIIDYVCYKSADPFIGKVFCAAIRQKKISVIERMLKLRPALIETVDHRTRENVLSMAASTRDIDVVAFLTQQGAQIGDLKQEPNALTQCLEKKSQDVLFSLLPRCTQPTRRNILFHAVRQNMPQTVCHLTNFHKLNVDSVDSRQNTALMLAAAEQNEPMIRLLLELGARANNKNLSEQSAITIAFERNSYPIFKLLYQSAKKKEPLIHFLARTYNISFMERCIEDLRNECHKEIIDLLQTAKGTDESEIISTLRCTCRVYSYSLDQKINVQNEQGNTPLMAATLQGDLDMIQCLLDAGAAPSIPNKKGQSPLSMTATVFTWPVFCILVKKCTNLPALMHVFAASGNDMALYRMITQRHVNVDDCNEYQGKTLLEVAYDAEQLNAVKTLLLCGITPLYRGKSVYNYLAPAFIEELLFIALKEKNKVALDIIRQIPYCSQWTDKDGDTVLIVALKCNYRDAIIALIAVQADPLAENREHLNAFQIAWMVNPLYLSLLQAVADPHDCRLIK